MADAHQLHGSGHLHDAREPQHENELRLGCSGGMTFVKPEDHTVGLRTGYKLVFTPSP